MISAAVFVCAHVAGRFYPAELAVTVLDVGQGDAAVLNKNGAAFIIDGGGKPGADVLVPYLDYLGVKRTACVFISHFDEDHFVGLKEVIAQKRAKAVFYPPAGRNDTSYSEFVTLCGNNGIPLEALSAGDALTFGSGEIVTVSCLHPETDYAPRDLNEASLVLKVAFGGASFLFTGDIGAEAERILASNGRDVKTDILKLAHHGSKYSSSDIFLEAASPIMAVCGVGKNNTYGHPSAETLERLEKHDVSFYNTAENGAVIINTDGKRYRVRTMLE